jgi:gamma-glutamyltranspeptidase/glutathione hydrolase
MRRAFRDRARYLADSDFADPPLEMLTSKEYAEGLRAEINPRQASVSAPSDITMADESPETTHYSVVDSDGMAVAVTYTLEAGFGSKITVPGGGFLLNNEMGDFNAGPGITDERGLIGTEPNLARSEQRMLSSMTPTILAKDGRLVAVTGSPGGRTIINSVLQVLLNITEFGMPIEEAVAAKRLHHQWLPDGMRIEAEGVTAETVAELEAMGHTVRVGGGQGSTPSIFIDAQTGELIGAPDPRDRDGGAVGY